MGSSETILHRYWLVAPSRNDPLHKYDGKVVLSHLENPNVRAYLLDFTENQVSFDVPRRKLARWHHKIEDHKYCYCQRENSGEKS